ncbi:MAG: hypothetical protein KGJ59_02145 [Bacteroidota bacterium]|nr:hypothetical protein [Bacteroidota bacterium]
MKFNPIRKLRLTFGIKSSLFVIAGIAILALVYWSCNITNPLNNIAVIFNSLSIDTHASVNFVDAATGIPIGSSSQPVSVTLKFSGPDAAKIVDASDKAITSASTTSVL